MRRCKDEREIFNIQGELTRLEKIEIIPKEIEYLIEQFEKAEARERELKEAQEHGSR